jgi:hypothetical protein
MNNQIQIRNYHLFHIEDDLRVLILALDLNILPVSEDTQNVSYLTQGTLGKVR